MDVIGPLDVFALATELHLKGQGGRPLYRVEIVAEEADTALVTASGIRLLSDVACASLDRTDTLLIAGGFGEIAVAQNVPYKESVDLVPGQAVEAEGTLLKDTKTAEWGGYSGYFADPDGHPWEIARNPLFPLVDGQLRLPESASRCRCILPKG